MIHRPSVNPGRENPILLILCIHVNSWRRLLGRCPFILGVL